MKTNYFWLLLIALGLFACNNDDSTNDNGIETLPALTSGEANFSTYVSVGNSLTAGFTDGALFMASQQNSYPNILATQFALIGGGTFTQPFMNDNFGGLAMAGNRIPSYNPRLVTTGGAPLPLESVIGPVTVTTDIILNNPTGPFNNMGVPGAKSFHLLANGYGNIANVSLGLANPYFVRMTGSTPDASVLQLAISQSPSFFSLWIGSNDVLGYALSGGDGSNVITDQNTFDAAFGAIISALTSGGAKGVVANIPYVTDIPHFTTVPFNPIPLDAGTAAAVNSAYAPYNGGLLQAESFGLISSQEREYRTIVFEESETNAVVIVDESLTDLSGLGLPNYRQATANDLLVLTAASFIGTEAVPGNPLTINGVAIPLADKWVLIPSEQQEIKTAIDNFNTTIINAVTAAGLAFVDANSVFSQMNSSGYADGDFILTTDLVTGGAVSLDGVHPTSRGSALAANLFLKAIDATYGSNFEASGNLVDIGNYPTNYSPLLQ